MKIATDMFGIQYNCSRMCMVYNENFVTARKVVGFLSLLFLTLNTWKISHEAREFLWVFYHVM
jgi:hypothetical protein